MKWLCLIFMLLGCSVNGVRLFDSASRDKDKIKASNVTKFNAGPTLSNSSFQDQTELYGLGHLKAANYFIIDYNQDTYSDIVFLPDYFSAPKFLIYSDKEKKFNELDYSPFKSDIRAHYLLFYDFNSDGILDVIVGVLNQKTELKKIPLELHIGFKEDGKLFFKKKEGALSLAAGPHASVIPVDFDLDGDLDLFVGNWFDQNVSPIRPVPDNLLRNVKGVFKDVSELLTDEAKTDQDEVNYIKAKPTYASSICDINQDGYVDILSASTNGYGNKLWLSTQVVRKSGRIFQDKSIESRLSSDSDGLLNAKGGGRTFSILCSDYNNDSIMDVFVGEIYHNYDPESTDKSSILSGSSTKLLPQFIRTEYTIDSNDISWHQADRRAIWFDYNNDGLLDLLIDNSGYPPNTRMVLFEQLSDHSFVSRASDLGLDIVNPLSSVLIDVNKDGKWDVLTSSTDIRDASIKKRMYLFINNHEPVGRPVRINLGGDKSNRDGIGATVIIKLTRDGKYYKRQYNIQYSQGGLPPQNENALIVGIAPGEKLTQIIVRWPYAKSKNDKSYLLEKIYKIKGKLQSVYTLCESGYFVTGKKGCHL